MTLGPLSNRIGNSKCKQGFLRQGTEIGNQPVLSSSDQEFRKKQEVTECSRESQEMEIYSLSMKSIQIIGQFFSNSEATKGWNKTNLVRKIDFLL